VPYLTPFMDHRARRAELELAAIMKKDRNFRNHGVGRWDLYHRRCLDRRVASGSGHRVQITRNAAQRVNCTEAMISDHLKVSTQTFGGCKSMVPEKYVGKPQNRAPS
jgi:hypothetical protein